MLRLPAGKSTELVKVLRKMGFDEYAKKVSAQAAEEGMETVGKQGINRLLLNPGRFENSVKGSKTLRDRADDALRMGRGGIDSVLGAGKKAGAWLKDNPLATAGIAGGAGLGAGMMAPDEEDMEALKRQAMRKYRQMTE